MRVHKKVTRRFKSVRHLQRFVSVHDQAANLFMRFRYNANTLETRQVRASAFEAWKTVIGIPILNHLLS